MTVTDLARPSRGRRIAPREERRPDGRAAVTQAARPLAVLLLGYWLVLLTTVLLYVLACDPLPPCRGTVTEWIRRLVPARAAAEEGPA